MVTPMVITMAIINILVFSEPGQKSLDDNGGGNYREKKSFLPDQLDPAVPGGEAGEGACRESLSTMEN